MADLSAIEAAIEESRKAMAEGPAERINAATEALTQASHRLADVLYRAASASSGEAAGSAGAPGAPPDPGATGEAESGAPGGGGNVVDAEFVDVDESKRPN